jgi:hypothetical protein
MAFRKLPSDVKRDLNAARARVCERRLSAALGRAREDQETAAKREAELERQIRDRVQVEQQYFFHQKVYELFAC